MWIKFDKQLFNFDKIGNIEKTGNKDDTFDGYDYAICLNETSDGWLAIESFKTEQERDARFDELCALLTSTTMCGECGKKCSSPIATLEYIKNQFLKTGSILHEKLTRLNLPVRTRRNLEYVNIITVADLINKTEEELLSGINFGKKSLTEVKEALLGFCLKLREKDA